MPRSSQRALECIRPSRRTASRFRDEFRVVVEIPEYPSLGRPRSGALGDEDRDKPTLTIYLPRSSTTNETAIVVAPGGVMVTWDSNMKAGKSQMAQRSRHHCFVLKYRLGPRYHHPIELGDAQRACVWCDRVPQEFVSGRIGSHDGFRSWWHLVSTASTHFDAGDPPPPIPLTA